MPRDARDVNPYDLGDVSRARHERKEQWGERVSEPLPQIEKNEATGSGTELSLVVIIPISFVLGLGMCLLIYLGLLK